MSKLIFLAYFVIQSVSPAIAQPSSHPIELGKVQWLRDYDEAVQQSATTGKPVFLLFQEVPGCSNCTQYGNGILSHPLIVEAIESEFVPLAIYNNKGGPDGAIVKKFKEPTWNNPVVRLINEDGTDYEPRISNFRSTRILLQSMARALFKSGRATPQYLSLLATEYIDDQPAEAYFSMYCFWTGEKEIAQLDGVLATEAGFMHGKEVVKVTYNEATTDLRALSVGANKVGCADQVYANGRSNVADRKPGKYRKDGGGQVLLETISLAIHTND